MGLASFPGPAQEPFVAPCVLWEQHLSSAVWPQGFPGPAQSSSSSSRCTFEPSQGSGEVGSFLVLGKLEELCICPSRVLPHRSPRLMPTVRVKRTAGWTRLGSGSRGAFRSLPQAERNEQNCVSTTTPLLRLYLPPAVPFCWSLAAEL